MNTRFLTVRGYYQFPENIYEILAQIEGVGDCVFYGRWADRFDIYERQLSKTQQAQLMGILITNHQVTVPRLLLSDLPHLAPYIELSLYYPNLICTYYGLNPGNAYLNQSQLISSVQILFEQLSIPDVEIVFIIQTLNQEAGDILIRSEWSTYLEFFTKIYDESFWKMVVMGREKKHINRILIGDYAKAFGCLVDEKSNSLKFPNSSCELVYPTPFHENELLAFKKLQEVERLAVNSQRYKGVFSWLQRYAIVAAKRSLKICGYSNIKFHQIFDLSPQALRKYRHVFRNIMD